MALVQIDSTKRDAKQYDGIEYLKKAQTYAHRIDWLLSSDDGEDTFHERLKEDLSKIE